MPRIPKKQKLDSSKLPSKCTLPSVLAYPTDKDDEKFFQMHFLPTSDLTGIDLFNAFVNHCNNSENHCVCVSRSFQSDSIYVFGKPIGSSPGVHSFLNACLSLF